MEEAYRVYNITLHHFPVEQNEAFVRAGPVRSTRWVGIRRSRASWQSDENLKIER